MRAVLEVRVSNLIFSPIASAISSTHNLTQLTELANVMGKCYQRTESFVWWRHRPTVKSVHFLPLILHQSLPLCCRKVREHGEWFYIKLQTHLRSLRERTPLLFAISDKHSGRLLNFLCCFLYLELGLSWVIHAWTSDFKLFQEN